MIWCLANTILCTLSAPTSFGVKRSPCTSFTRLSALFRHASQVHEEALKDADYDDTTPEDRRQHPVVVLAKVQQPFQSVRRGERGTGSVVRERACGSERKGKVKKRSHREWERVRGGARKSDRHRESHNYTRASAFREALLSCVSNRSPSGSHRSLLRLK